MLYSSPTLLLNFETVPSTLNLTILEFLIVKSISLLLIDWWYIRDSKGKEGWAPANYFQPMEENRKNTITPTNEYEQKLGLSFNGEKKIIVLWNLDIFLC